MDRTSHDRLRAKLPDEPRWIEARALLATDHASVFEDADGFLVRNDAPEGDLVVVVGEPSAELLREALADRPERELLAPRDATARLLQLFPDAYHEAAILHEQRDPSRLADAGEDVRELTAADDLSEVPPVMRAELEAERDAGPVFVVLADGRPVCFAYAFWRTEGWFDISVDTLATHRRRGFARRACSALIRRERAGGREPVWGSMATNEASLALARELGFVATDELVVVTPDA